MKLKTGFCFFCLCILACVLSSCTDLGLQNNENNKFTVSDSISDESKRDDKMSVIGYAYGQLSEHEQALYDRIKDALFAHEPFIDGGLSSYTADQLSKIIDFVFIDYPEIFWATNSGTVWNSDKTITKYEFDYILNESQRNDRQNKIDRAVTAFLNRLDSGMNEYEKTLAVYEYIINNTLYNSAVMDKITNGLNDAETNASQTIASVFIDGSSVCSGYAKATQYLLNKLDIFCTYVSGYGKGQNHAWNLVNIYGDYYFLDTTWGAPINEATGEQTISYDYFLVTTEALNKTHTPTDKISLPICTATKYNYHIYNNLMLVSYDSAAIEEIIRNAVAEGKNEVSIRFSDEAALENAMNMLFENDNIFNILSKVAPVNPTLDDTHISYSFNPDGVVLNLEFTFK